MSIFFEATIFFFFFYFMNATPKLRPSHFCTPNFSIETSGALFTFLAMRLFSTFEIKRGAKYVFYLFYGTRYFIFRVAASNYEQIFLEHSHLKKKSLMVRPWCTNRFFILFRLIIIVSLLIPRFLLPALRWTLFVSRSLLFAARCSMIGYFSRSSLFLFSACSSPIWVIWGSKC